jgi:hypothetical protein
MRPGCNGEHAVGAHRLLGEGDASVNLITEGDHGEEEEEWWVNTVRAEEGEEDMEEVGDSEPEENGEREIRYFTSTHMRKDDSRLEDKLEYFWEAPIPSDSDEREEDRCLSPEPQKPSSEEDKKEVQYLTNLLELGPKEKWGRGWGAPPPYREYDRHQWGQPTIFIREACPRRKGITRDHQKHRTACCEGEEAQEKETWEEGNEGRRPQMGGGKAGRLASGATDRQFGK